MTGGPLSGVSVVEAGGIGPGPFAAMLLSDLGAEVIRIDAPEARADDVTRPEVNLLMRGRRSVGLDLKKEEGRRALLQLIDGAQVLIEGFRPGVAERLGFGPEVCLGRNPRLVYGRVTGWGRDGELAAKAGHDINYIALAGVLAHLGKADGPPIPPLNLVGDFAGGGMLLAFGITSALVHVSRCGVGQVVDAAMVDGAALLMTLMHGLQASGMWTEARGANLLDGGAPFYRTYETSDGRHVAVGAAEPKFFSQLLTGLGLGDRDDLIAQQYDRQRWPDLHRLLENGFRGRTLAQWCSIFATLDGCVTPVLTMTEAPTHPHNQARSTFVTVDGVVQPGPAPRFSETPADAHAPPPRPCQHTREVLSEWGFADPEIDHLLTTGAAVTEHVQPHEGPLSPSTEDAHT